MHRRIALSIAPCLLCAVVWIAASCKDKPEAKVRSAPALGVELRALDTALAPRGDRPFVAGEKVFLALTIRGGRAPFEIQVVTKVGDPQLAAASATVESPPQSETDTGLELELGSEVVSGPYTLTIRVSDQDGQSSSVDTESFEVLGSDAPTYPASEGALRLEVVDVAGRARRSFYQGEAISIRATLPEPKTFAIAIVGDDEHSFMPTQQYPGETTSVFLPMQVPRVARVGQYRVDIATSDAEDSVPLTIVGTRYPAATKAVLTELHIFGGPQMRIPREGVLTRGEAVRIEAIAGGIAHRAVARLRLRTRVGKQVALHEFPALEPADAAPEARSLLSAPWTPPLDLARGRHMLELELEEGDNVSTLFREIVLQ